MKFTFILGLILLTFSLNATKRHPRILEDDFETDNPDLEMLEALEEEDGEARIFDKLVAERKELNERMKLLDDLVDNELKKNDDEEDGNIIFKNY
jgi:hypothetical protein